ncbi:MAG TPA: CpXC domain-containing protein, partial [Anaerolineales bacterium]
KTRINCPNCRQPIVADIEQLFDVGVEPSAKQRLLSGLTNVAQCPHCGYQGSVATPLVYHDPEKELLLTFFPPEMGLTRDEQERLIGGLINKVVNNLPQEKRKGYLLRPQTMLTFQGMLERILEADGITREMIQAQQTKLNLLQRLLNASEESRIEMARNEDELIDAEFFGMLSRLLETSMASNDRETAQALAELQKSILPETTFGRQLQEQTQEVEAALSSLQEIGQDLTRDKLLDLVIKAPNDTRVSAFVSLARPVMDYTFFQILSDRIDRARGDGRTRLIQLRERLLDLTRQVDQQLEARAAQSRQLLDNILQAEDVSAAAAQYLPAFDDFFIQELNTALEAARGQGDLEKINDLQRVVQVIQEASSAPPEIAFIEELLDAPDETTRQKILEDNQDMITPEFLDTLTGLVARVEGGSQDQELVANLKAVHRQSMRYSMQMKFKGQ